MIFDHPLVVGLVVVLAGAVIAAARAFVLWLFRFVRNVDDTNTILRDNVLPHFTTPSPGRPDVSLPGRVDELVDGQSRLRKDLLDHMAEERTWRQSRPSLWRTILGP